MEGEDRARAGARAEGTEKTEARSRTREALFSVFPVPSARAPARARSSDFSVSAVLIVFFSAFIVRLICSRFGAFDMRDSQLLVIGIDGGASHTVAVLADARTGAALGLGDG